MTTLYKFANNFRTTLNGGINNSVTTIVLTSASGLPSIGTDEVYSLTISDGTNTEEITVTDDASSPSLTVTRNADGRGAYSFASGSIVSMRPTATQNNNFLQIGQVTQYTDEMAQDAVGAMIDSSLAYVDGTPLLQRAALTGDITASAGSNTTTIATPSIATVATDDKVIIKDTSNSDATRYVTVQSIRDLTPGSSSITSAQLAAAITDETGTNKAVFSDNPTLVNPVANNFNAGITIQATSGVTTTLTVTSNRYQVFTGATTETVAMPAVSTLSQGTVFTITNLSSGAVDVQASGGLTIQSMAANTTLTLVSNTIAGSTPSVWTILRYGAITITSSSGGMTMNTASGTTQALAVNNGYICTNASQCNGTLPATAAVGDLVKMVSQGAGGIKMTANTGQTIKGLGDTTTSAGSITCAAQYDSLTVICIVANTTWAIDNFTSSLLTFA